MIKWDFKVLLLFLLYLFFVYNKLQAKIITKFSSINVISVATTPALANDTSPVTALDDVGGGVVLGADSSSASGVLVLESSDKALILPKVTNPHLNMKSPTIGAMCYDTTSKSIAIFNGKEWAYWK